jgi:DNA recombination protein RmuC
LQQKSSTDAYGDYIMQSHFTDSENNSKIPDAMVFLPDNHILIIDSKSSSHFLELQQCEDRNDEESIKKISQKLKERMKSHLNDLKKRSYAKSKLENLDLKNIFDKNDKVIISTAMFLQTEKMIDIVRKIYPDFEQKCLDEKIWLIGPIGLINLLNQTRFIINYKKQENNIDKLRIEVKKMIESVGILLGKSQDIGKNLFRSMKSFNDFATSFNNRFLSRISNMSQYGIEFDKKNFSKPIEKYNIESNQSLIEYDLDKLEKD